MRRTLTLLVMLALAAPAQAAVFQVAAPGAPGASDVACTPCATIQGAIIKADVLAGADDIHVAAGTYGETLVIGPTNPVTVTGAGSGVGPGATIVQRAASEVVQMSSPASTLRSMTFRSSGTTIVRIAGGTLDDVQVSTPAASLPSATAVQVPGGGTGPVTIRYSAIVLPFSVPANYGVYADSDVSPVQIEGSLVRASYAVNARATQPVSLVNSVVQANIYCVSARGATGSVTVHNSLLLPISAGGFDGTGVFKHEGSNAAVAVSSSTIVGPGTTTGVAVSSRSGVNGSVTVVDSIISGHLFDIRRSSSSGNPVISLSYSLYDPSRVALDGSGVFDVSGGGNATGVLPQFVAAGGGDFRLLPASPGLDTGTPGPLAPGEPAIDITGAPRLADGNGDGTARRDMGAFERESPPSGPIPPPVPVPPPGLGSPGPFAGPTRTATALSLSLPTRSRLDRPLRVGVTNASKGRLVLVARTRSGRVVAKKVVASLAAGSHVLPLPLGSAARPGTLVVSGLLTGGTILPTRDTRSTALSRQGGAADITLAAPRTLAPGRPLVVTGRTQFPGRVVVVARNPRGRVLAKGEAFLATAGRFRVSLRLPARLAGAGVRVTTTAMLRTTGLVAKATAGTLISK